MLPSIFSIKTTNGERYQIVACGVVHQGVEYDVPRCLSKGLLGTFRVESIRKAHGTFWPNYICSSQMEGVLKKIKDTILWKIPHLEWEYTQAKSAYDLAFPEGLTEEAHRAAYDNAQNMYKASTLCDTNHALQIYRDAQKILATWTRTY